MELIVEKLVAKQTRKSTIDTYLRIWHNFNKFVLNLDVIPKSWEQRATLYVTFLIEHGRQSSSIKSYISAIKKLLMIGGYKWQDDQLMLSSLTKACRLENDRVYVCFPIQCSLLELMLFEVGRIYHDQAYLQKLYKAVFALSYYVMMRIGEITESPHVLLARNVHIATNKDKMLLILYSSKTHGLNSRPQKIKIMSNRAEKTGKYLYRHFCPFLLLRQFLKVRGTYATDIEQLFIFKDNSPLQSNQATSVLKRCISNIGLNCEFYSLHSFRIGRTTDLIKFGYSVEEVSGAGSQMQFISTLDPN